MVVDSPGRCRCSACLVRRLAAMAAGLVLALSIGIVAASSQAAAPEQAPWIGTWQLNAARSTARSTPSPYKRVVLRIEPAADDGLVVVYDMVGTRGGVTHVEWSGQFDGRDYPVQGMDYVLTNAYRRLDDRSYEIVIKVDGQPAATAVAVVSPDGRTLTVTTAERGPGGQTANTTAVYERR